MHSMHSYQLFKSRRDIAILQLMDELTIDDKKYVSSKRAAQITGYAKDYIGQLCREGYVEAKRVGRSWYVLEAAIKDHRFGNDAAKDEGPVSTAPTVTPEFTIVRKEELHASPVVATSSPRYEALEPPSINLLRKDDPSHEVSVHKEDAPTQDFHAAWQTWFDAFHTPATHQASPLAAPVIDTPRVDTPPQFTPKEVISIPIHHLAPQELPLIAPLPLHTPPTEVRIEDAMHKPPRPSTRPPHGSGAVRVLAMTFSIVLCVGSAALALIGTGYLDNYLISIEQAHVLSGVLIINK